jgi:PAB1-binding protein PBP1
MCFSDPNKNRKRTKTTCTQTHTPKKKKKVGHHKGEKRNQTNGAGRERFAASFEWWAQEKEWNRKKKKGKELEIERQWKKRRERKMCSATKIVLMVQAGSYTDGAVEEI